MTRGCLLIVLFLPFVSYAQADSGFAVDPERGRIVATVRCMQCHHLSTLSRSIGPGLKGVYGRAPTISGVPFAVWDEAALDAWLTDPRAVKANTRMQLPPIVARDRADIIAWFKSEREK